jgi:hypothetical protein
VQRRLADAVTLHLLLAGAPFSPSYSPHSLGNPLGQFPPLFRMLV